MKKSRHLFATALVLATTAGLGACGWGIIDWGGGGGGGNKGNVIVEGNIDQVLPVTTRDIVVFVYSGSDPKPGDCPGTSTTTSTTMEPAAVQATTEADGGEAAASSSCDCPAAPANPECTPGNAVVLSSGTKTFTVGGVDSGEIRVVFLLDNAGNDADGQIDPGDPIAVLDDINCKIDDVNGNTTITLTDVDIEFSSAPVSDCKEGSPPAPGRARALIITTEKTPSSST